MALMLAEVMPWWHTEVACTFVGQRTSRPSWARAIRDCSEKSFVGRGEGTTNGRTLSMETFPCSPGIDIRSFG